MSQHTITIIINNNVYNLSASNIETVRSIPETDRGQLLALLDVMKQQESAVPPSVSQAAAATNGGVGKTTNYHPPRTERLSSGDVDSIMAQLIMEERSKQKPGMTKQTLYKWMAVVAAVVMILAAIL